MTRTQIKFRLQSILGCYGDSCWPCGHHNIIDRLIELIEEIVGSKFL